MIPKTAFHALVFTQLLFTPVVALGAAPAEDPPAPAIEDVEIDALLDEVKDLDDVVNGRPLEAAPDLANALLALNGRGREFAGEEAALSIRRFARLNLARAYLDPKLSQSAAAEMDKAIREALGQPVPEAKSFGPDLEELYAERVEALEAQGWAELEIECVASCKAYLNENEIEPGVTTVPPGPYRLLIVSDDGKIDTLIRAVDLSAEQPATVKFGPRPVPAPPPPPPLDPVRRLMPLGAEITLMVLGTGMSMAGAALVASAANPGATGGGVALMAVGLGTLTTGSITLGIDQTKAGTAVDRRAVIGWRMQF